MLLTNTCASRLCSPVGIHTCENFVQLVLVKLFQRDLSNGIVAGIDTCHLFCLKLFRTVTKVVTGKVRHFNIHTTIISNFHATSFRAFCFYNDDTVCCFRTIDSLSCSVLQQSDTFYHVHVQVHNLGHVSFKTIQNEERLVRV